jgi:enterochelin esterase family protein
MHLRHRGVLVHPELFGNVLSQSGAFWYQPEAAKSGPSDTDTGWLSRQLARTRRLPLRFYLQAGRFEGNILDENRRLRDVLEAKGYPLTYSEYDGGHDCITRRGSFADGLLVWVGSPSGHR